MGIIRMSFHGRQGFLQSRGRFSAGRRPSLFGVIVGLILGISFHAALCHADEFGAGIRPVLAEYCFKCHSTEKQKGDLDLEIVSSLEKVRTHPKIWQTVLEQLGDAEMPPKDKPQPSAEQKRRLMAWVRSTLDVIAIERAGDPGQVTLRRLSNAEYTYTLRDLTGLDSLVPAREFPVDGAAGEGFTNTGQALVMSPSLLTKYLDAAKSVATHLVLLPDGIRFSTNTTRRDWTNETLARIRELYAEFSSAAGGDKVNLQGIAFSTNEGGRLPLEKYLEAAIASREAGKNVDQIAKERHLSAKYLGILLTLLNSAEPSPLLENLRKIWKTSKTGDSVAMTAEVAQWQRLLWKFGSVGHIGKVGGPKAWLEPVTPLMQQQETRFKVAAPGIGDEFAVYLPAGDAKEGIAAYQRIQIAFDEFRRVFPPALCYTKIVPVDEVVTLTLFHREDEHLAELMLDDARKAKLDRLWDELRFVSQDALTLVDAFEQLWQFATQDADPKVFEPMRKPILERAAVFRQRIIECEPAHVTAVLEFAARAYRRPLHESEKDALRGLYKKFREKEQSHDDAIRLMIARVLVSPAFLYRAETPGTGMMQAPLNDWELATRLSYFLWSSEPDAELLAVAAAGKLHDPAVLASQAHRMTADARIRRLATEFACQWLHIHDFNTLDEKSERYFPTFAGLREAMYEESIQFFTDFFQFDRSVLQILDADHTFLNEALANHYGIPGVTGTQWRRVDGIKKYSRGGILGQATTLAKQSGASRTSPILRGNWVAEVLLGDKLPRPPKDVPRLPEDESNDRLTMRQLTEKHTSDPRCAGCHARMDAFGFTLEGFDAIGRRREKDLGDRPVDTRAKVMDGTELSDISGLRGYLLNQRRDAYLRQFCRKLLGYSLGRAVQLSDEPLLKEIQARLTTNDYRVGIAIDMIVQSRQFREIRGRDVAFDE